MPIQSVFTSQAPAEAPAARSRAGEARRGGEGGEVFALPKAAGAASEAVAADKAVAPASVPQEAKADAGGIAVLVAMATVAETASADEESAEAARDEAAGEGEVVATPVAVPVVLLPALPPAGGETVVGETGARVAKDAAGPALAIGLPPVETAAEPEQAGAVPAMEGKAGQGGVQAAGIPGPDIPAKAGRPATEARAPEASQPPPAPLDLSSLLPQAPAAAGHERLAQAFASGPAPDAAPQGAAGGQPTPVHVVPIEIGLRAMAGLRQFDIRLDPDELGRVDVALSISEKGEVSARLVVDRVETLHLLQRDARTLERAFEQAGLKPSDGGIDISLRDPSGQPGFRQNREQDEAPQRSRPADGIEPTEEASLSIDPVPQRRLIRLGGVDLSI